MRDPVTVASCAGLYAFTASASVIALVKGPGGGDLIFLAIAVGFTYGLLEYGRRTR